MKAVYDTDYASLQDAIDTVWDSGNGGGTVIVAAGTRTISTPLIMRRNVNVVGLGDSSVIVCDDCDGFTYAFTTGLGNSRISNLLIQGSGSEERIAIHQPSNTDLSQELNGITIDNVIIRDFNIGMRFNTVRKVAIRNVEFLHVNSGIHFIGACYNLHLDDVKIVFGDGNGEGTQHGLLLDGFTYTAGYRRPEGLRAVNPFIHGFNTAISLEQVYVADIIAPNIQATIDGVVLSTVIGEVNVVGGYVEIAGANARNCFRMTDMSSVIGTKVVVAGTYCNAVSGVPAATTCGVKIGSIGSVGNFDGVDLSKMRFTGHTLADIAAYGSGALVIEHSKCGSSVANSIIVKSVPSTARRAIIADNICEGAIDYDAADLSGGKLLIRQNVEAGLATDRRDPIRSMAFTSGNFTTPQDPGNWTVQIGDHPTGSDMVRYALRGKLMTVWVLVSESSIARAGTSQLHIAIPAGKVAAQRATNAAALLVDNGVRVPGYFNVEAGAATISASRVDGASFSVSNDSTFVYGQISFEVQ